jgi:hypothetical protein
VGRLRAVLGRHQRWLRAAVAARNRPPVGGELGWRIGYGSFATIGAIIVSRRHRNVIGWILCAIGISSAVAGFAQDYASYALLRR